MEKSDQGEGFDDNGDVLYNIEIENQKDDLVISKSETVFFIVFVYRRNSFFTSVDSNN